MNTNTFVRGVAEFFSNVYDKCNRGVERCLMKRRTGAYWKVDAESVRRFSYYKENPYLQRQNIGQIYEEKHTAWKATARSNTFE